MKKIIFIFSMIIMVLILGSCRKSNGKEEQSLSKTTTKNTVLTITYACGDSSWNQTIDTVARGFMEQYSNITIELSSGSVSSDMYADYLKNQDAVGELGDIVEMTDVKQYAENGRIMPLPEEITSLVNNSSNYNGKIYSVSTISSTQGIIYNKKIFSQIGVEEPKTYEEFLTICDKITKYKLTPIIVGGKDLWHMGFWINHFFRNDVLLKNPDWQKERSEGLVSWTDAEPRQMMEHIMDIFGNKYVNEDFPNTLDSSTASTIAYGKAVMLYSGPWMFSQILNLNPKAELGWFYLPDKNGDCNVLDSIPAGWSITTDCAADDDKYNASLLFLRYFYSNQVYTRVCENMNAMPATRENILYTTIPVQEKLLKEYNAAEKLTSKSIGDEDTPEGFLNYMYQLVQETIGGKYTVDEALGRLDARWDKNITD